MGKLGKYEIRSVLGRGAMGTVYEAWDPVISRRVAVKTVRLPEAGDEEAAEKLARFQQEAQAAGSLQHPNIVGVFDYAETDELAYIVMELVDGRTLKSLIEDGARPGPARIGRLMDGLLSGLAYSHERGVIHRDIKPANVIVTAAGQVKIADFGIARIESSTMTQVGSIMGTPAYMSPEQFLGGAVTRHTDIYSAGIVLYQLLTGKRPFEGSMATIMRGVLNDPIPPPSTHTPTVPPALDAVVARATARLPGDRFPHAMAFDQALKAALPDPAATLRLVPGSAPGSAAAPDGDGTTIATAPRASPAAAPSAPSKKSVLPRLALAGAALLALGSGAFWATRDRGGQPDPTPPAVKPQDKPILPLDGPASDLGKHPTTPPSPGHVPSPEERRLAVNAAAGSALCSFLVAGDARDGTPFTLTGVVGAGTDHAALRSAVRQAAGQDPAWDVTDVPDQYCALLDLLRPYADAGGARRPVVRFGAGEGRAGRPDGPRVPVFHEGELLRLQVNMPDEPGHLQLDYFEDDGVLHMSSSRPGAPFGRAEARWFGDPRPDFGGWGVSGPFGTELIVAVSTPTPLFRTGQALPRTFDAYLDDLRAGLAGVTQAGGWVLVGVTPVQTEPKAQPR